MIETRSLKNVVILIQISKSRKREHKIFLNFSLYKEKASTFFQNIFKKFFRQIIGKQSPKKFLNSFFEIHNGKASTLEVFKIFFKYLVEKQAT